jgi:antirestriction protein
MTERPSNNDDVIDSRDVIEAIAELEAEGDDTGLLEDELEELAALRAFAEDGQSFADWEWGEAFIRDSYFEDYAQELAEDIGAIKGDESWPANCIDWEQAARELQMDYTAVEFDGVTYWGRS